MQRTAASTLVLALSVVLILPGGTALAAPVVIGAGDDHWQTPPPLPPGVESFADFSGLPLPPDFFDPGSDPFVGRIQFQGEPLGTMPPGALGAADTIVRRPAPTAPLDFPLGEIDVPIEIVALHLVSVQPITVTYNGGFTPELWDVRACLSQVQPQQMGNMTIRREHANGGTFDSVLPVMPRLIFTRMSDSAVRVIDPLPMPLPFRSFNSPWSLEGGPGGFSSGAHGVDPLPAGIQVDGSCAGILDQVTIGASNFRGGFEDVGGGNFKCRFNKEVADAALAGHDVAPPGDSDGDGWPNECDNCPDDPNPGQEDGNGNEIGDVCEPSAPVPVLPSIALGALLVLLAALGIRQLRSVRA